MIRSFASGILVGGVLSALVLAVASVVAPPQVGVPAATEPAVPPDAPAASTAPAAPAATVPIPAAPAEPVPDAPAGAVTPVTPTPAAPPADGASAPATGTEPAAPAKEATTPATGSDIQGAAPDAPAATDAASVEKPATAPQVAQSDVVLVPAAPEPAKEPATNLALEQPATAPATNAATPVDVAAKDPVETLPVAEPPNAPDVKLALAPLSPAPASDAVVAPVTDDAARTVPAPAALAKVARDVAPAAPATPAAPPKVENADAPAPALVSESEPSPALIAQADPKPLAPGGQTSLPQIQGDTAPPAMDTPPALAPAEPEPRILTEEEPLADANSATLAPAPRLGGAVEGVVTGRLPRIGQATPIEVAEAAEDDTPLVRYAQIFENPDEKPIFSVILIDTGAADLDRKALAELPFPVSFALDPMDPAAQANAAIYRAAGQEVLMLATGIPEGATASDLEVSFAALSERMPEAVAILDQPDPVFQDDRPLATQVVPILAAQGRGMVTWDEGLNAADQVARREGLPSVMAFRFLDGENEKTETVRRYLDRAAFRAAQDGRVVVIGQTRPETVEALIAWGLEGRSASVALAPISAALSTN